MGARRHRALKTWLNSRKNQTSLLSQHALNVQEPMILISQISRSGGTLLKELLDNHSQLWVMHRGLKYSRRDWPRLDPARSRRHWWQQCHRGDKLAQDYRHGFIKKYNQDRPLPFLFNAPAQKALFHQQLSQLPPASSRAIWEAYLSSYFTAWMDYQHRYSPKRGVVNFSSWVMLFDDNVDAFFEAYPDGQLIQIVRQPVSWCASVNKQGRKAYDKSIFQAPDTALPWWVFNAEAVLRNKARFGDQVIVVEFDALVRDTENTMRALSDALGIEYQPSLLTPTMNGMPILANSSFTIREHGVQARTAARDQEFDEETLQRIRHDTESLWQQLSPHCINRPDVRPDTADHRSP